MGNCKTNPLNLINRLLEIDYTLSNHDIVKLIRLNNKVEVVK